MPITLPVRQRQVGQEALPGYRQSGGDLVDRAVEGLGRDVAQTAHTLQGVSERTQREQDAARVQAAYGEITRAKVELLTDPKNGFLAKQGQQALADSDMAMNYFEELGKKTRAGLANDRQRSAFDSIWRQASDSYTSTINGHVAKQSEELAGQAYEGALGAAQSDYIAAATRGDTPGMDHAFGNGLGVVDKRAGVAGWAAEYAAEQRRTFETQARLGALDAMIEGRRGAEAQRFYQEHVGSMDATMVAKSGVQARIEASVARDRSRMLADQAWQETGGDPVKAGEWLRGQNIDDTQVLDEATQRVEHRASALEGAVREKDRQVLGKLRELLYTRSPEATMTNDLVRDLSPDARGDWAQMIEAERLRKTAEQRQRDDGAFQDFLARDIYGTDGEDQASVDISRAYPGTTEKNRDRMTRHQKDVQARAGVSGTAFSARVRKTANDLRYNPKVAKAFVSYMNDAFMQWGVDHPGDKTPSREDVDRMVADAIAEGTYERFGPNPHIRRWELPAGKEFIPDTPQAAAAPQAGPAVPSNHRRVWQGQSYVWNGSAWVKE
jgi:hypothetical protein